MQIKFNELEYTSLGRAIIFFFEEVPDVTEILYDKIKNEDKSVQLQVIGLMYKEFNEDKDSFEINYSENDFNVFEKNQKEIGRILHKYFDNNIEGIAGDYFLDIPGYFQGDTPINSECEADENYGDELIFENGLKIEFVSNCGCWDEIFNDYFVLSEKYVELTKGISKLINLIK
jgi:hypothetical protein